MLTQIKAMLGINNNEFDSIINDYIDSAKLDLSTIGIAIDDTDKLIRTAIITYVKGMIDIDHEELYMNSYYLQKDYIRHLSEYQEEE